VTGGNVGEDMHVHQLKKSPELLSKNAIGMINDQISNSHFKGGKFRRKRDDNPWDQRDYPQDQRRHVSQPALLSGRHRKGTRTRSKSQAYS
jgi:hypothetical protein